MRQRLPLVERVALVALGILVVVNLGLLYLLLNRDDAPSPSPEGGQVVQGHSAPTRGPATKSATRSPTRTATPSPTRSPTPTATPTSVERPGTPQPVRRIEVTSRHYFGRPFKTVSITGVDHGAGAARTLRVEHREQDRWTRFPIPASTRDSGRFTAYVEMGAPGSYRLRIVDVRTNEASPVITLDIE